MAGESYTLPLAEDTGTFEDEAPLSMAVEDNRLIWGALVDIFGEEATSETEQ